MPGPSFGFLLLAGFKGFLAFLNSVVRVFEGLGAMSMEIVRGSLQIIPCLFQMPDGRANFRMTLTTLGRGAGRTSCTGWRVHGQYHSESEC